MFLSSEGYSIFTDFYFKKIKENIAVLSDTQYALRQVSE